MNLSTLLAALAIGGASLTAGLDGLDASIDSLVHAKTLEQHAVCKARTAAMLLPAEQRESVEESCKLYAEKEVQDRFAGLKDVVRAARFQ